MARVMPKGCRGCKHYRFSFRKKRDWCVQVDDGYSNDCLLDGLGAEDT